MLRTGYSSHDQRVTDLSDYKLGTLASGSVKARKLVTRLVATHSLDDRALSSVESLYHARRRTKKSQFLYSEGSTSPSLYVVEDGWLLAQRVLADGRRQVLRTYMPGEIAGISELGQDCATSAIEVLEGGTVYPITPARFEFALTRSERLAAAMMVLLRDEVVALSDRVQAIGRMSAKERLIFFLLKHIQRLRIVDPNVVDTFKLPLSQTDIGDALGLTHTYVSKVMRDLDKRRWIERDGQKITFLDEDAMKRCVGMVE